MDTLAKPFVNGVENDDARILPTEVGIKLYCDLVVIQYNKPGSYENKSI